MINKSGLLIIIENEKLSENALRLIERLGKTFKISTHFIGLANTRLDLYSRIDMLSKARDLVMAKEELGNLQSHLNYVESNDMLPYSNCLNAIRSNAERIVELYGKYKAEPFEGNKCKIRLNLVEHIFGNSRVMVSAKDLREICTYAEKYLCLKGLDDLILNLSGYSDRKFSRLEQSLRSAKYDLEELENVVARIKSASNSFDESEEFITDKRIHFVVTSTKQVAEEMMKKYEATFAVKKIDSSMSF